MKTESPERACILAAMIKHQASAFGCLHSTKRVLGRNDADSATMLQSQQQLIAQPGAHASAYREFDGVHLRWVPPAGGEVSHPAAA